MDNTKTTTMRTSVDETSTKVKRIALAGLFAALSYIGFAFFKIDISVGGGKTAFHFANSFVVLAALFLGGPVGGLAGGIGLSIADLTSGYATSAPLTFILKFFIGFIAGTVAHKAFRINEIKDGKKLAAATIVSSIAGLGFNVVADPTLGYLYHRIFFGMESTGAELLAKFASLTTTVNALISVTVATILYLLLRPALRKADLI
ncbi:MAG: ECF transporter S component [Catonella sp.]|jgi:uncharacterized membrane protein|nr:ECF transporter S component [Catonella sp.]MDY6355932.1 ECF transporter S component [Catonella sp.]